MNEIDQAVFIALLVGAGAIGVGIFLSVWRDRADVAARVSGLGREGLKDLQRNTRRGEREGDEEALPA